MVTKGATIEHAIEALSYAFASNEEDEDRKIMWMIPAMLTNVDKKLWSLLKVIGTTTIEDNADAKAAVQVRDFLKDVMDQADILCDTLKTTYKQDDEDED